MYISYIGRLLLFLYNVNRVLTSCDGQNIEGPEKLPIKSKAHMPLNLPLQPCITICHITFFSYWTWNETPCIIISLCILQSLYLVSLDVLSIHLLTSIKLVCFSLFVSFTVAISIVTVKIQHPWAFGYQVPSLLLGWIKLNTSDVKLCLIYN